MTAAVNPYATAVAPIGRFVFPVADAAGVRRCAVVVVGGAHLVLRRTFVGRALRAFAQDRTVAAAFGIDHRRLGVLLGGVAGATAAVAGMLFALGNALTPATAFEWFGIVFAVVILGGIGNVVGTLAAGRRWSARCPASSPWPGPRGGAVRPVLRDHPGAAPAARGPVRA